MMRPMESAQPKASQDVGAARFNRICIILAALWLVAAVGTFSLRPPGYRDFGQYYMGGLIARLGHWESLYPIPDPGSGANAGWQMSSKMRPLYAQLATEYGIGDANRFIHPPPAALLLAPLSLLKYRQAYWLWIVMMATSILGVAICAGTLHRIASGRPSRLQGILTLLVATSPLALRTLRTVNISPLVALAIGGGIIAIIRDYPVRGASVITLGTVGKYAAAILLPLALIRRCRKLVALTVLMGGGLVLLSLAVMGAGPFVTFAREIAPTLAWAHPWSGNQSMHGFLLRLAPEHTYSAAANAAFRVVGLSVLIAILILIYLRRLEIRRSPEPALAAAAALLLWWPLSSPIFWDHYYLYFCPLWGWLAVDARGSRGRTVAASMAVLLTWIPLASVPNIRMPEPLGSHMLVGALLMLFLATSRLVAGCRSRECATKPEA